MGRSTPGAGIGRSHSAKRILDNPESGQQLGRLRCRQKRIRFLSYLVAIQIL